MIIIAACLYLPHHISFLTHRAWFYYHGDDAKAATTVTSAAVETMKATLRALEEKATDYVAKVVPGEL